ncbi:urease accessory protein UreD [Streptomyces tubbatahanensis]|uniref:urease accessory protein UreD n=1 Tax=Streptomyces tubbatahanensis TaxID=2923272 RepID=UPI003C6F7FEB
MSGLYEAPPTSAEGDARRAGETSRPTVVAVERDGARNRIDTLRPGAFLAPMPLHARGDAARIALVGTTAGLLAGDALALDVTVGPGAALELTETAGLVAYDHRGGASSWRARVTVAAGGRLQWEGKPFVAAAGARVDRGLEVFLGHGATMLWRDTLVLGRSAERGGSVRSATRVLHEGRELFVEELDLTDHEERQLPGILGSSRVVDAVAAFGRTPARPHPPLTTPLAGPGALARTVTPGAARDGAGLDQVWRSWATDL